MDAGNFNTIHDILRYLSLMQSLLKGRNAPIWRMGNRGVNIFYLRSPLSPPHCALTRWSATCKKRRCAPTQQRIPRWCFSPTQSDSFTFWLARSLRASSPPLWHTATKTRKFIFSVFYSHSLGILAFYLCCQWSNRMAHCSQLQWLRWGRHCPLLCLLFSSPNPLRFNMSGAAWSYFQELSWVFIGNDWGRLTCKKYIYPPPTPFFSKFPCGFCVGYSLVITYKSFQT